MANDPTDILGPEEGGTDIIGAEEGGTDILCLLYTSDAADE